VTISTTTTLNRYTGNSVTTVFPYTYRILAATDLVVTKRAASTLVETTLVYPTDYSVSGVGNTSGGSVTLTVAPASGDLLVVERAVPATQPTSIRNQGSYFPETHENVFDRQTMVDQQQATALGRTFSLPKTLDPASYNMELPVPVAGQVPIWTTNGLTNGTIASSNVVLPGEGRDTSTLTQYLANNYVYNILDYDADPTGALDSTAAINAAATACLAAGGGVVFIPRGTFRITSAIQLPADVWLCGAGRVASQIVQYTAGQDGIRLGDRNKVTDLLIGYNSAATAGTYALKLTDVGRCKVTDVVLGANCARHVGVLATAGASSENAIRNFFTRVIVLSIASEHSLVLTGGSATRRVVDTRFLECDWDGTGDAIQLNDWVQGTRFAECITEFSGRGVNITPTAAGRTFDTFFDNCVWDATTTNENLRAKNTNGIYISDSWFGAVAAGVNGVHLESTVTRCLITGGRASHKESGGAGTSVFFIDGQTSQIKGVSLIQGAVAPTTAAITLGVNSQLNDIAGNTLEGYAIGKDISDSGTNNRIGPNYNDAYGAEARHHSRVRAFKLNINGGADILGHLSVSSPYDPPSIAAGAQNSLDMTVTGVALGDTVVASFDKDLQGIRLNAGVKSTNTVTVIFRNDTGGAIDLASGNLRVDAWKH
jgi:hypothetical protein